MKPFYAPLAAALMLIARGAADAAPGSRGSAEGKPAADLVSRLVRLDGRGHSPRPPFDIRIEAASAPASGRQRVRVLVTPVLSGERLDVRVEGKDGLSVAGGAPRWSGRPQARRALAGEILLAASGAGEKRLSVVVTQLYADGRRVTAGAAWAMAPRRPSLAEQHPGSRRAPGRGAGILELKPD